MEGDIVSSGVRYSARKLLTKLYPSDQFALAKSIFKKHLLIHMLKNVNSSVF